MVLMEKNF